MDKLRIKNFPFTSILGWSFSRNDTFTQCKRKYYYNYYAKFDPEYSRNKIDSLKSLSSVPLEIGNIAHDVIKGVLERLKRTLEPIDMVRFEKHVEKIIISKLTKNFFEIYYRQQEKIDINEIFPKTIESLNNLFESSRFEWIKEKAIPSKDQWLIEPSKYGESRMGDLKLYCKVDFLFPVGDQLIILDWKTGKKDEEKHSSQLVGYAAWAAFHLDWKAEDIVPIIVYLHPEYEEITFKVSESDLDEYRETIYRETQEMYSYCSNYQENIPLSKEEFPMRDFDYICRYCNFKELCDRQ